MHDAIVAVALEAISTLVTPRSATPARLETLAEDIAFAAELAEGAPFTGPAAQEASALALVAIASTESDHFRARVLDCEETGDSGRSVSAFGLMRGLSWYGASRADLCPSSPVAAYNALRVLRTHAARCRPEPRAWFSGYASGSCAVKSDVAELQCRRWVRLTVRAGIVGASCDVARPLEHSAAPDPGCVLRT